MSDECSNFKKEKSINNFETDDQYFDFWVIARLSNLRNKNK